MDIKELREKRAVAVAAGRAILDQAEEEKRDVTDEEQGGWDAAMADAGKLKEDIDREERQAGLERDLAASQAPADRPDPDDGDGDPENRAGNEEARKEQREAFGRFLRGGLSVLSGEEKRALQADSDEAGGYTIAPEEFVTQLIKAVDDQVFIRPLANVKTLTRSDSMGAPSLDADPADADWTSELATGSEDSTMDFGKRELKPKPLAKRLKVSNKLLRSSAINVEAEVMERLAYKFAITQEKGFLTGDGATQPLGVFTASALGISTGRDVSTGNVATSIQTDGLIECKYSLKGQYWRRAGWIFHRDALKQIAKLKDGNGQYIWQEGIQAGQPDRLLNAPILGMSEYAPNTFTTGLYVGILGDFSQYWIADALDMQVQRLVELYAEANQVGFIGRLETDGMPVLEEAFARVKLA